MTMTGKCPGSDKTRAYTYLTRLSEKERHLGDSVFFLRLVDQSNDQVLDFIVPKSGEDEELFNYTK